MYCIVLRPNESFLVRETDSAQVGFCGGVVSAVGEPASDRKEAHDGLPTHL